MKAPPRNAIGKMIRLAIEVAACWVLAIAPTNRPIDMKARIPQTTSGMVIHQNAVSLRPKYGSVAIARNTASWISPTATAIQIRARTIEPVLIGASRSLRSSLSCRQLTSVMAAPKVAPEASAQPSRPGVKYWIDFSDLSSTWLEVSVNRGALPDAAWLAAWTIELSTELTSPALVWSAIEKRTTMWSPRSSTAASWLPLRTSESADRSDRAWLTESTLARPGSALRACVSSWTCPTVTRLIFG